MFKRIKKIIRISSCWLIGKTITDISSCLRSEDVIISFDVFDTLIIRKVKCPTDIFDGLDGRDDFKQRRIYAEHRARVVAKNEEITIREIYEQLFPDDPVLLEKVMAKEIKKEVEVCTANEAALSLFNNLLKQGKQIILISDMYLSEKVIKEILTNCGYDIG